MCQPFAACCARWGGLSSNFEGFSFADGDGWVYPRGDRVSVRDRSYYPKLAAGGSARATLISRLGGQPVLLITVPVRDDAGKLVGTLGGTILLNRFFARTVSDARVQTGHFLLLDSRNRLPGRWTRRRGRFVACSLM